MRLSSLLLLDVNALLALGWREHQAHGAVVERLDENQRWASCNITQLGFIRISSNPGVFHQPTEPAEAARFLATLTQDPLHLFIDRTPAPTATPWPTKSGYKQTTDVYLIELAEKSNATLLTFDLRLKRAFPNTAVEALVVS